MNVLVVSADPDVLSSAQRLLELRGTPPDVAPDLETALRDFAERQFELIALDLPADAIAAETIAEARRLSAETLRPGLVVLLYDRQTNIPWEDLLATKADDFLPKPIFEPEWMLTLGRLEQRLLEPLAGTTTSPDLPRIVQELQQKQISQRIAQISAAKNRERLSTAALAAQDGLWSVDITQYEDGNRSTDVWFSPRFKQLLGFEPHELPDDASAWFDLVHPDDQEEVQAAVDSAVDGKGSYKIEYRIFNKQGEERWFSARGEAKFDHAGRPYLFAGSVRDITDERNAHIDLLESEGRFRTLVENTPEPVLLLTDSETIDYANPAALRMLVGWDGDRGVIDQAQAQVLGGGLSRFLDPGKQLPTCPLDNECSEDTGPVLMEFRTLSGTIVPCEVTCARVRLESKGDGKLLMLRDITDRVQFEAQQKAHVESLMRIIKTYERDRKLWAYEIHDGMIQYLSGGIMRLQALADPSELPEEDRGDDPPVHIEPELRDEFMIVLHLLKTALTEGRRTMEGLRPPALDQFGLVAAIQSGIERHRQRIYRDREATQIAFEHPAEFGRLATILEDNLYNMAQESINNAIRHGKPEKIKVGLSRTDGTILLTIEDNGRGFDLGNVPSDRFGLKGIHERASLLGGEATISSTPDVGTTVRVQMPVLPVQE